MEQNTVYCFEHKDYGKVDIYLFRKEKRLMFSDKQLRRILKVKNKMLPIIADVSVDEGVLVDFQEVFEYIRYSNVNEDLRYNFEEWLTFIVSDMFKIL